MTPAPGAFAQRTVGRPASVEGRGLHTGENCRVTVAPAGIDEGVYFLSEGRRLTLDRVDPEATRCSALRDGSVQVQTVEHLLAAVSAAGITNLSVTCTGPELPALDGSALPYWRLLQEAGLLGQQAVIEPIRVREPLFVSHGTSALYACPADELELAYTLDYDHPALKAQKFGVRLTPETFASEVAPARTFCTRPEADELKRRGYGKGADTSNTLVMDIGGPVDNALRYDNEPARHKTLDLIGDLALAGAPVIGKIIGIRSGHRLNRELVRILRSQR